MNPPGRCRVNIFGYIPPPCATPPARRYPSGFAGVSFATVSGLVVGWLVVVEGMGVAVVDGVFHKSVRCRGRDWWPRCGSLCWPSSVLMAWASVVFEVVGVVAGRGLGGGRGRCCPLPLSMGLAFRVFDVVVMFDGRGVGRCAGRRCGRWCVPQECSMLWVCPVVVVWVVVWVALVVAPLDFKRVRQCSTMCTCSLAVNWVDSLAVVGVDGVFHKRVR